MNKSSTLQALGVTKSFGDTRVLDRVSVTLAPGRIHVLAGANGSGKSVLLKLLSGYFRPEQGQIVLDGTPRVLHSPHEGLVNGIYRVPQEPLLFPDLTVAENILCGLLPASKFAAVVGWKTARQRADEVLTKLGAHINPDMLAHSLTIAQQQVLECARALVHDCRILLFDEPTSPLTPQEVDQLFGVIDELRDQNYTIAFISHRHSEVFKLADDITVLRNGQVIKTGEAHDFDEESLIIAMLGDKIQISQQDFSVEANVEEVEVTTSGGSSVRDIVRANSTRVPIMEIQNLSSPHEVRTVSFSLFPGEVVGLGGLVGSGRTETAETIMGLRPMASGRIVYHGRELLQRSPESNRRMGICYIPEDRKAHSLFPGLSGILNASVASLGKLRGKFGWLLGREEQKLGKDVSRRYTIPMDRMVVPITTLSGGSQQKIIVGRWLATNPTVAIFDEPTRGVDVGVKEEIYELVKDLAHAGMAILYISSEFLEFESVANRVLVMREGTIVQELMGKGITEENILFYATSEFEKSASSSL